MTAQRADGVRPGRRVATHQKVAVSVPAPLLAVARRKVAAGQAPSLSAVVAQALAHELGQEDAFERLVDDMLHTGELVISEEDRAWARQALAR